MDGKSIYELLESEKVTYAAGVPTVWQMLLNHMKPDGLRFSTLKRTVIGGSACPPAMIEAFQDQYGVEVLHAWGMTEMSPLGTLCTLKNKHLDMAPEERLKIRLKQGRAIFGVDMKVVGEDGKELPWGGATSGDLHVKGPWVVREYFKGEGGQPLIDGWFPTGDVATIDADGYLQITDRSKDVIKSGGEVDQLDRDREHRDGAPGGRNGRVHRRRASQMGRAADRRDRQAPGCRSLTRGTAEVLRRQDREVANPRRRRVRRGDSAGRNRQDAQDQTAASS